MSGMAYVDVVFASTADLPAGRVAIAARVDGLQSRLPAGVRLTIGPEASATGWVFQYALVAPALARTMGAAVDPFSPVSMLSLRRFQDQVLVPALAGLPGVAEVASVGGQVEQVLVEALPDRLRASGLALSDLVSAVASATRNGARFFPSASEPPPSPSAHVATIAALPVAPIVDVKPTNARPADVKRQLVLVEVEGDGGPLEALLNNSHWNGLREGTSTPIPGSISNGRGVQSTENPRVGATEIWEIANLTEDAHPIHLHLIQFQAIARQTFDRDSYRASWDARFPGGTFNGVTYPHGTYIPGFGPPLSYTAANAAGAVGGNPEFGPFLQGSAAAPDPKERGWKDTIKMLPFTITRIAVRYAPQAVAAGAVHPGTNLFPFDPSAGGPGYVWHCHILDHEDNEMMRPTLIQH